MISPGAFLYFLKNCKIVNIKIILFFIGPLEQFFKYFFSSSSVNAIKRFCDVPHLLHMCVFFSLQSAQ